jgi:hypothetical protein
VDASQSSIAPVGMFLNGIQLEFCPPASTSRPSGENATESARFRDPAMARSKVPLAASHSFSVSSSFPKEPLLPESTRRPSGENALT